MENKPFTKTGKELLATKSYHWQLCGLNLNEEKCTCDLGEIIIAIEEEAKTRERKFAVERAINVLGGKG